MKKKLQVFVSSTYLDLKEERQAAVQAILEEGHIPAGMELFTAGDKSQWEVIRKWIQESDIVLFIIGVRCGAIHPETEKSYVQMEYEFSVEESKPHFALFLTKQAMTEKVEKDAKVMGIEPDEHPWIEKDKSDKFREFRATLKHNLIKEVSNIDELKHHVGLSIRNLINTHDLSGWVSGKDIQDVTALNSDIIRLEQENSDLKTQLEALNTDQLKDQSSSESEGEFTQIVKFLISCTVDTEVFSPYGPGKHRPIEKYTLLELFKRYSDHLTNGLTAFGDEADKFIVNTVCPKLFVRDLVHQYTTNVGVGYRLSQKGLELVRYLQDEEIKEKERAKELPTKPSKPFNGLQSGLSRYQGIKNLE